MKKTRSSYHHGNLAESLLNAVDDIASQFGLEAVTLRACSKRIGVSPSSAFRHYPDKRALLTSFATRALLQLASALETASVKAQQEQADALEAVCMAYIEFAVDRPAFFRAMWREETIYTNDEHYVAAAEQLSGHLKRGFADSIADTDPLSLSAQELLAWSSVHGLANLFVDGPMSNGQTRAQMLETARAMVAAIRPAFEPAHPVSR